MNQIGMTKQGLLQNFAQGLEYEYRAMEYCEELLNLLEDEKEKKIVQFILSDEKKHIQITKDLMEIVENTYLPE